MRRDWGRRPAIVGAAIVLAGLIGCGWRWWDVRRHREAMARIDDAMRQGRYATAARELSTLTGRGPGSDRVLYLLGLCEKALGRTREADAAWAAITADSPLIGRAVAARMDMLVERGRLAEAEELVERAVGTLWPEGSAEGSALRLIEIPMLVQEGRADEARRVIEARWRALDAKGEGGSEQAINLARLHMEMRWNVTPAEAIRESLEQSGRLAPDDDRIRLGRANLALRAGSFDEAKRWLDDCLSRRPDDRAVWRARLEWALRTKRLDDARAAFEHLPSDWWTSAELHRLSARMAALAGDAGRELRELAALVAEEPEDFAARERLETLESPSGTADARPRRPRAEIERDRDRYVALYRRNQPARDAEEMGRLAERLGHRFEAILFLAAAAAEEPDRADLRAAIHRLESDGRTTTGRDTTKGCDLRLM